MAPKRIYAFRHAQAEHKQVPSSPRSRRPLMSCTSSVDEDYSIPDSPLTQLGRSQASQIPNHPLGARANAVADLVVTSPLKRTLQTTLLGFKEARSRVPTIALPALQECNDHPCDTGSSRQELEKDPELGKEFNFSALPDDWTSKKGFWAPTDEALYERLAWVRRWLRDRPEKNIVVVAHGDALRWLTKGKNDFSVGPTWHSLAVHKALS